MYSAGQSKYIVLWRTKIFRSNVKHDSSDNDDIWRQTRSIYARGNAIVNKFQHCSNEVKIQLFKAYICNLYTSQLWCEYKASTMHLLKMSYNNVFRKFFGLNRRCSVSTELAQRSIKSFQNIIQNYIKSTYIRLYQSNNVLFSSMCKSGIMLNSKLMRHWYNVYNSCIWIVVIWYKYIDPESDSKL